MSQKINPELAGLMSAAALADSEGAPPPGPRGPDVAAALDARREATAAPADPGDQGTIPEAPGLGLLGGLVQENLDLLTMGMDMLSPMLPFLPNIYTAEVCKRIAERAAAVEAKYNVSPGALFGKYKDEVMLAAAVLPPTLVAFQASKAYIAQAKAQAAATLAAQKEEEKRKAKEAANDGNA